MIIYDMPQQTDEWFAIKAGKMSGTSFATVANGKPATKKKLAYKLAAERMTGQRVSDGYTNSHMERGNALEADARAMYCLETGAEVKEVGFIMPSDDAGYGISPDGIILKDGQIVSGTEIKCKDIHTHLECLLNGGWKQYKWQIQGTIMVCECESWDFISYNPYYGSGKDLFIEKVNRDEELIKQLTEGIDAMENEIARIMEALK